MKEHSLTKGSIFRSLLTFAVPVFLALFLQAMYGAADLIIVGQFAGTGDQSGVASGSQLFNTATMLVVGLTMGVTVFVARCMGAGEKEKAARGVGTSIVLFALVAVVGTAIMVPGSEVLTRLVHAPQEAFGPTQDYIQVCGIGMVFIVFYNVLGAIFRGLGDSRTPLFTVAVACLFNIAGDLFLVAGLGMGAKGAAIATVAAQALSVLISLVVIWKRGLPFAFSLSHVRFFKDCLVHILKVGIPIALQDVLVHFSFLFIQIVVNGMGVVESAAVGVAEKVCVFLMLTASAFMQSISAFVAQNNGAGLQDRSRKALSYGIRMALFSGAVMGALALFFGDGLATLFSRETGVILAAHSYLKAYAIDCLLTAILFCFVGFFNGCGKTVFVMLQGVIGAFCVRIPVVYLMSALPGATLFHVGLGTPASSLVQIVLCLLYYRHLGKKGRLF